MHKLYKSPVYITKIHLYIYCLILGLNQAVKIIPVDPSRTCDRGCIAQPTPCLRKTSETYYYYNTTTFKCTIGTCERSPRDNTYPKLAKCRAECGGWCQTILQFYKPEDKCLEPGSVLVSTGKTNTTFQGSSIFWIFNITAGECSPTDLRAIAEPGFLLMDDIKFTSGVFTKSKAECDKICPPITMIQSLN